MGGAVERIFLALCTEWARQGHQVTMISRLYKDLPRRESTRNLTHLRLRSFNAPKSKLLYRLYDILYAIRAARLAPPADITITHSVALPLVIPISTAGRIYVSVARYPKRHMWIYRRVHRLQAVSTHIERAIQQQSPSVAHLTRTIPNCVSAAFAKAITDVRHNRRKEIIFVGRIAREKGVEILIRAFLRASEKHPGWRLIIVGPSETRQGGDGADYLDELKLLASESPGEIEFTGPIFEEAKLISRFQQAEVFVYPSIAAKGEALPLAPIEAMACGCVVVVSSLDCFNDYLKNGENGYAFDENDSSGASLATILCRLMESDSDRQKIAQRGIATAREYAPSVIARRFVEDFHHLLSLSSSKS